MVRVVFIDGSIERFEDADNWVQDDRMVDLIRFGTVGSATSYPQSIGINLPIENIKKIERYRD